MAACAVPAFPLWNPVCRCESMAVVMAVVVLRDDGCGHDGHIHCSSCSSCGSCSSCL